MRGNDWNATSGRWPSLREGFGEFKQSVRFHLLADTRTAPSDLSVRVTGVRREATAEGANLLVSLHLAREQGDDAKITIPLQFEIDGARSELSVDMAGAEYDLKDHPIPLAANQKRGWGHVSIPADLNPADNDFYFVLRRTAAAANHYRGRRSASGPCTTTGGRSHRRSGDRRQIGSGRLRRSQ